MKSLIRLDPQLTTWKVVKVDGKALTFAIPPKQRKYSRRMFGSVHSGDAELDHETSMAGDDKRPLVDADCKPGAAQVDVDTKTNGDEASEGEKTAEYGDVPDSNMAQDAELTPQTETGNDPAEAVNIDDNQVEANEKPQEDANLEQKASEEISEEAPAQTSSGELPTPAVQEEDVLHSISVLTQLENKIVDIDGRFNSKEIATQNTWRSFRGIRNNQDLGTLFEMREEFYVFKHPRIVKEGRKKR